MNEQALASQFYITARSALDPQHASRLKHGDTFAVFDPNGDLLAWDGNPDGVYHSDTRFLSHFELRLNGARPLLLSSTVQGDNAALVVDLTNPDFFEDGGLVLPKDTIHLHRLKFLWESAVYERLAIFNYGEGAHRLRLSLLFNSDFADLFEARGQKRRARGIVSAEVIGGDRVGFRYLGLDGEERRTELAFCPNPDRLEMSSAVFDLLLEPHHRRVLFFRTSCGEPPEREWTSRQYFLAMGASRRALRRSSSRAARVESSSALLDEVVRRAGADLTMLTTETEAGPYPYAGIPWFSTPFGRDGIITALLTLWNDPAVAQGVLCYLAATQSNDTDPYRDAEPGKILHETRGGEMAALREVPFGLYYGSVDSTPLFVMLAGAYLRRTGDLALVRSLWPNLQAALGWIERYGDRDGDGFVEYDRQRESGLVNQGWKDSNDSIFHADGSLARGPIALCEVQAYVYGAWCAGAEIAEKLGEGEAALSFRARAEEIRIRFEDGFWCEDLGVYALALDGNKRPCRVVTSNAGHALFAGIAAPERAARVAETLIGPGCFTGWGIRTLATQERRYNPMSYHNGSVWPHDNAMLALGFARYGLKEPVLRVFRGLIDAASHIELRRLPELFCGFGRKQRKGPTSYPVACSPQAWAAATPFALIQASLGLELDHDAGEVRLSHPALPSFLDRLTLRNLQLDGGAADLLLSRHGGDVAVTVLERRGDLRIMEVH